MKLSRLLVIELLQHYIGFAGDDQGNHDEMETDQTCGTEASQEPNAPALVG